MKQEILGNTNEKISRIGFGAMRLPACDVEGKTVTDEEKSEELIYKAYEKGINYFDTAPYYCDCMSEKLVGKALKPVRDRVKIATKLPWEHLTKKEEVRPWVEKSLKELDTDYIDFYQLWSLKAKGYYEFCIKCGIMDELAKLKNEGIIHHIGFTFHNEPDDIYEILKENEILETMLVRNNIYYDHCKKQIDFAYDKGIGIVNMGAFCSFVPEPQEFRKSASEKGYNPYEIALKYLLQNRQYTCILSSFNSIERLENTFEFLKNVRLNEEQKQIVDLFLKDYNG